jgi:glucose uptake protein GlcU
MAACTPAAGSHALNLIDPTNANLPTACANQATLNTLLGDLFILLGAISVLMIVIAGLRYVMARGNSEKTTQAKNIIQYSIIGLIISSLAYAIVSFVITNAG